MIYGRDGFTDAFTESQIKLGDDHVIQNEIMPVVIKKMGFEGFEKMKL